ncbi:TIGR03087 family PEP-CTERM/XrtA system glycosyltransferase [Rugamonas sp.]|uniref:TIGR03087 family PEP-CTERM/XrtA system glycosyltransferase n=1 Tax=Rugamonas sp. TaxID=1926287 RepID=UPI0025FD8AEF|nr:TIGR03087 family PEP-CTERM/XrtA system glycosyltransferase [Rugamonas sp.]
MDDLLLLIHRIPYPPNKGDKIRSYHLLRYLSTRYRVHLATFVDDADDWQHVPAVRALCASSHFAPLSPLKARLRSLGALLFNRALSLDYYRDAGVDRWVRETVARVAPARVLAFSSPMAQYWLDGEGKGQGDPMRRVIDFCDVDSDKWRQYAARKRFPASLLYRYEADRLLRYERTAAARSGAALFVSQPEAELFRRLAPESAAKTGYFSNGVDTDFFSPAHAGANPYEATEIPVVFCGAMDYWPNVDAVTWFADAILPAARARLPALRFYIVGARPSAEVQQLAARDGIRVTGTVDDVRPYVVHAALSVAPLRVARGIQNKVLEAMAMSKAVIVTPAALEGIDAEPGRELVRADDAATFIAALLHLLAPPQTSVRDAMGRAARALVTSTYGWDARLAPLARLLELPARAELALGFEPESVPESALEPMPGLTTEPAREAMPESAPAARHASGPAAQAGPAPVSASASTPQRGATA